MKTKQLKLSCLFLSILFVAQSCVVSSLHPLYTDSDRVHLDELDGVWMDTDNKRYEITTIIDSTGLESKKEKTSPKGMTKEEVFFSGSSNEKSKIENFFFNPDLRKHYQIKIISEKDTSILDGKLSNLDGHYFLDVTPNEKALNNLLEGSVLVLIARTHGFFKLDLNGDILKVNTIEYEDFEELIKNKKIRIEHVERDEDIIITAKTSDIQKFLIKFADSKMFNDPKETLLLKRVRSMP